MSHFTVLRTQITETNALVAALADLGFKDVEVHEQPVHLHGYLGDARRQVAEVVIRRDYVGPASNDIGFARRADGTFDAIISGFDRLSYSQAWVDKLTGRYAYHATKARLSEQGFSLISEEAQADGRVHLVLRRMG